MEYKLELEPLSKDAGQSDYDVVIIGAGPAGATAAIYTSRAKLRTLVIDKGLTAGALGITGKIANYPGIIEEIAGAELLERMRKQAQSFGAEFVVDKVIGLDVTSPQKVIYTNNKTYSSASVIIATGSMGRVQRVEGEEKLLGHGVSYCATCDGPFFRDKEVAVAGNCDESIEEGLFLSRFASHIHFFSPTQELKAPQNLIDELSNHPKVTIYKGATLREIVGEKNVQGVRFIQRGQPERTLPLNAAFIYLKGSKPVTDFLKGQLNIEADGCLAVDRDYRTPLPGVYAVGDVLCKRFKQAVIAAAEGAVAGMAVEKELREQKS
jgi:thioredoxin reductase (NADPH)